MIVSRRLISGAILLLCDLCGACAVGPSPNVTTATYPIVAHPDSATTPTTRHFLDSLSSVRTTDRPDSTPATLWQPVLLSPASPRDVAWLDILRDSELVALVRTAVANNRDLRIAEARVREFRAEHGVARGDLFPQLSANAIAGNYKIFEPGLPSVAYSAISAVGELSWELDFWGRLRRQTQAANFDMQGRQEDARAITLTLVSDVATSYLEL